MICPVCGGRSFDTQFSLRAERREIRLREDFVRQRLHGNDAAPAELKDLTDFMHGFAAPLVSCRRCRTLVRAEEQIREAHSYNEDPNDLDVMEQLFPRYVEAFRNKRPAYREMLKPGADVLELGSHLGAFLQVAEEWGWRPVGIDVGDDTTQFSRRLGLSVVQAVIPDAPIPPGTMDGVFVWNCFEQLENPGGTLAGLRNILKPGGLLTLRVPNAEFYRALRAARNRMPDEFPALGALAYNNLLGFPYLYGYSAESLTALLRKFGFEPVRGFNSELVTMPFADPTESVQSEQRKISRSVGRWASETSRTSGRLLGPWIEVVYRKASLDDARRIRQRAVVPIQLFHPKRIDPEFLPRAAM